jgi:cellulose synthase/poly-beta-1,6-N-acetylglucosamine synthase-like glycosyltransferase
VIWVFEVERLLFRVFLLLMCAGMLRRVWRSYFTRARVRPADPAAWPLVTVQLPVRDEHAVAERAIRAACALDYPRLEVQILDDSDVPDPRLDDLARELGAQLVRRAERTGFKAGNLASGLTQANGELVAVFDADSIPPPEFLRRTVPYLVGKVGLVQTRQAFTNRDATVLTRVQASILDALMLVEQPGQSARDRPFHFNGSAGVWRRQCIDDAGGWRTGTSAEDIDLSHRATLAGWHFVHLTDVAVGADVPDTIAALRVQQERWTRGKVEAMRHLAGSVWRSDLPIGHRVDLILPVASRLLFPFLFVLSLTMPLTTFDLVQPAVHHSVAEGVAIVSMIGISAAIYYARAAQLARRSVIGAVALTPAIVAMFIGLSLSSTVAWLRGLVGRPAEFVPTRTVSALPVRERILAAIEVLIGLGYLGFSGLALSHHLFEAGAFFAFVALAWLWIGLGSLIRVAPAAR